MAETHHQNYEMVLNQLLDLLATVEDICVSQLIRLNATFIAGNDQYRFIFALLLVVSTLIVPLSRKCLIIRSISAAAFVLGCADGYFWTGVFWIIFLTLMQLRLEGGKAPSMMQEIVHWQEGNGSDKAIDGANAEEVMGTLHVYHHYPLGKKLEDGGHSADEEDPTEEDDEEADDDEYLPGRVFRSIESPTESDHTHVAQDFGAIE